MIAALLEREVQAAAKHPDIIERLRSMDTTPVGMIGSEVQARLKADREAWLRSSRQPICASNEGPCHPVSSDIH